jgi:hypothetical protein
VQHCVPLQHKHFLVSLLFDHFKEVIFPLCIMNHERLKDWLDALEHQVHMHSRLDMHVCPIPGAVMVSITTESSTKWGFTNLRNPQ